MLFRSLALVTCLAVLCLGALPGCAPPESAGTGPEVSPGMTAAPSEGADASPGVTTAEAEPLEVEPDAEQ